MRKTIDEVLEAARADLDRLDTAGTQAAVEAGAMFVDIRPVGLRDRDGEVPGALIVDRNQLEWRLDPASANRLVAVDDDLYERQLVVMCDEGYASTLAAVSLREIGLSGATDLVGGFQAWRAAGGPVKPSGQPSPASPTVSGTPTG